MVRANFVVVVALVGCLNDPKWYKVEAACNCGLGTGRDSCGGGGGGIFPFPRGTGLRGLRGSNLAGGVKPGQGQPCGPLVIRPAELKKIDNAISGRRPFRPIGDLCSCGQTIIKPAQVPRPFCGYSSQCSTSSSTQQTDQQSQSEVYGTGSGSGSGTDSSYPYGSVWSQAPLPAGPSSCSDGDGGSGTDSPIRADAVSLALAYKYQNELQNDFAEDRLSFGFRKLPKEVPCAVKKQNNIREENLYNFNGDVLEFKPSSCSQSNVDQDALEELQNQELEDEDNGGDCNGALSGITLNQLGYSPSNVPQGQFISILPNQPTQQTCGSSLDSVVGPLGSGGSGSSCNDGFKPGQVIIKETSVLSPSYVRPPPSFPCDDDAEGGYQGGYTYSSSTSSSNNNQQSGGVYCGYNL